MNKIKQAIYKAMTGYCPSKREFILLGCAFAAALPFILIKKGMDCLYTVKGRQIDIQLPEPKPNKVVRPFGLKDYQVEATYL